MEFLLCQKITNYILLYLLSQVSSILVDNEKSNSRLTVTFFTGDPYGIDVLENANAFCLKQVSKPKITNYILLYLLSQVSSILVDNEKSNSRLTVTFFIGDLPTSLIELKTSEKINVFTS